MPVSVSMIVWAHGHSMMFGLKLIVAMVEAIIIRIIIINSHNQQSIHTITAENGIHNICNFVHEHLGGFQKTTNNN